LYCILINYIVLNILYYKYRYNTYYFNAILAIVSSILHYNTVLYCKVILHKTLYSISVYSTILQYSVLYATILNYTVLYSSVHYDTIQCNV